MIACGVLYLNHNPVLENNAPTILGDHISGLPENTKVKLIYSYADNIIEKTVEENNSEISLVENQDIIKDNNLYTIHYSLQSPHLNYIDIELNVNKIKGTLNTVISGLQPAEDVSLIINKRHFYKKISSDWSGRITLTGEIATQTNQNEICLRLGQTP